MPLLIKGGNGLEMISIKDPHNNQPIAHIRDSTPNQFQDYPPQSKIHFFETSHHHIVCTKLSGVALKNLWVIIYGKVLTINAGVSEEKQENGEYHYTNKLLGFIRQKTTLPVEIYRKPEIAELNDGMLFLAFPKEIDEFLEQMVII